MATVVGRTGSTVDGRPNQCFVQAGLLREADETTAILNNCEEAALLDTSSTVSTISKMFFIVIKYRTWMFTL